MSEEESKLPNIRVYQPWSAPLLHFRLSEEQIERLVEQETVRQQDFLPPEDVLPRAINFAQTVSKVD